MCTHWVVVLLSRLSHKASDRYRKINNHSSLIVNKNHSTGKDSNPAAVSAIDMGTKLFANSR